MADRIVEGLWDCPYCGLKGIGGLTKHCPACGHPQDRDTRFYMGTKINYLEDDLAEQYGQGADWVCPYCGKLNRVHFRYCSGCGGAKEQSKEDYFSSKQKKESPAPAAQTKKRPHFWEVTEKDSFGTLLRACILNPLTIGVILLIVFLVLLFAPKTANITVTDKSWTRTVAVEDWVTVREKAWSVPEGGREYDRKSEIHHYDQVLDHYETRSRQVAERVYDGEDTYTSYSNNGDGTFTEHTYSSPRYRTEYHTEYYNSPVYRSVPVYQTKYYYEIERWTVVRTETSEGGADEPFWPELNLTGLEREGERTENYRFTGKDLRRDKSYDLKLPLGEWSKLEPGSETTVTYKRDGTVIKINGQEIETETE